MNVEAERSVSLWMATATVENAPPLDADARADVVVVGAGIAGLSTAYELARAGKSVIVLDRGPIGTGMTARTSAHLASEIDDDYFEVIRVRGADEARLVYESQAAAVDRIEAVARDEGIACDFRRVPAYLFVAPGTDASTLDKEIEACHRIGFTGVAWAEAAPVPGVKTGRCLHFPDQARFHSLKYLAGLIRCIGQHGGRLHGDSPVTKVEEADGEVTVTLKSGCTVRALAAVVATNSPINDLLAIHTKQAPYRTYCVAARVPKGSVADALIWDTATPYHYVRIQPDEDGGDDWLIVGGKDHRSGEAKDQDERLADLASWAKQHFPSMGEVGHRWSGQVMEPVDYLGFFGRNPGNTNVYVVTGDSGEGLTNGVAASLLIRDLVLGRPNAWAGPYDPGRISPRAGMEFVRDNLTVAENFTEYVRPGEVGSVDRLRPGQGAVIRQGAAKIAAFRDEEGRLHVHSATCSHAGCIVHWNPFERCWDCPCHGSQFSIDGEPLNGPAIFPLGKVDAEVEEKTVGKAG